MRDEGLLIYIGSRKGHAYSIGASTLAMTPEDESRRSGDEDLQTLKKAVAGLPESLSPEDPKMRDPIVEELRWPRPQGVLTAISTPVEVEALSTLHTECDVPHVPTEREWMDLGRPDDVDEEDCIDSDPTRSMCMQFGPTGYGCTQIATHTGPHRARGERNGCVYEEWPARVPAPPEAHKTTVQGWDLAHDFGEQ